MIKGLSLFGETVLIYSKMNAGKGNRRGLKVCSKIKFLEMGKKVGEKFFSSKILIPLFSRENIEGKCWI